MASADMPARCVAVVKPRIVLQANGFCVVWMNDTLRAIFSHPKVAREYWKHIVER